MLLWIFVIAAIGFSIWARITGWFDEILPTFLAVTSITGVIVCMLVILCMNTGLDGFIAENTMKYDSLVYEYDNDIYDNDNDLGKKELMNQIREWNEDLAYYKANQHDFWIGIFIPNIYDQFEFIELKQGD